MNIVVTISSIVEHEKILGVKFDEIEKMFTEIISSIVNNPKSKMLSVFDDLYKSKYEELEADLYICDNYEIKRLNNEYRNIDEPTDVLSFAMQEDYEPFDLPVVHLGEIIISLDKVIEQAKENSHSALFEFIFLLSHGVLHLFGVHHDTEDKYNTIMKIQTDITEAIVNEYNNK